MAYTKIKTGSGSRSYGVVCEGCGEFICLWPDIADSPTMKIFVPGREPVRCKCGSSAVYVSNKVVDETGRPTC